MTNANKMKRILTILTIFCTNVSVKAQNWGEFNTRTEYRNDAGLRGDAGAQSDFFETVSPVNYPSGANGWWHLLDIRHSNPANNYVMQFAGSFGEQDLYFRKTNNNASQPWSKVVLENAGGNVGIGTLQPENNEGWQKVLQIYGNEHSKIMMSTNTVSSGLYSHNLGFYDAPAGGIVGTSTNHCFSIITNKTSRVTVTPNGNVGIGTISPTERLSVNGNIRTQKVIVTESGWPDYVFNSSYQLPPLESVSIFIKENKHLPGMTSAVIIEKEGLDVGEIVKQQQQKIEELMLYIIEMKKEIEMIKAK